MLMVPYSVFKVFLLADVSNRAALEALTGYGSYIGRPRKVADLLDADHTLRDGQPAGLRSHVDYLFPDTLHVSPTRVHQESSLNMTVSTA